MTTTSRGPPERHGSEVDAPHRRARAAARELWARLTDPEFAASGLLQADAQAEAASAEADSEAGTGRGSESSSLGSESESGAAALSAGETAQVMTLAVYSGLHSVSGGEESLRARNK